MNTQGSISYKTPAVCRRTRSSWIGLILMFSGSTLASAEGLKRLWSYLLVQWACLRQVNGVKGNAHVNPESENLSWHNKHIATCIAELQRRQTREGCRWIEAWSINKNKQVVKRLSIKCLAKSALAVGLKSRSRSIDHLMHIVVQTLWLRILFLSISNTRNRY